MEHLSSSSSLLRNHRDESPFSTFWRTRRGQFLLATACFGLGAFAGAFVNFFAVSKLPESSPTAKVYFKNIKSNDHDFKNSSGPFWTLHGPDPIHIVSPLKRAASFDELPKHWDWRNYNGTGISLVTPVGNQMNPRGCGSCWAFATTRALSDRFKIAKYLKDGVVDVDIILSPQVLLDCGMNSFGSCHGGDPRYANRWIHLNGIVDETCSPYIASSPSWFAEGASCASAQCHECDIQGNCFVVTDPTKHYISEYGTFDNSNNEAFVLEVMSEIYYRGPVVVSMYAHTKEFKDYRGGYILRDATKFNDTTHDVSIVGWGEENGVPYWIVRNSFGTRWGEKGFFRVERGINAYNLEVQGAWAVPKLD